MSCDDVCLDEFTGLCGGFPDYTEAVNLRGLAVVAALNSTVIDGIDEAGEAIADSLYVFCKCDFLLGEHKLFESLVLNVFGDLLGQFSGAGAWLRAESEAAQGIELHALDKIEQFVEFVVGLAGKADYQCCPEGNIGDGCSQVVD